VNPGAEISGDYVRGILNPPDSARPIEQPVIIDEMRAKGGLNEMLDEWEKGFIKAALNDAKGNVAEAARLLKTDRANLYRRMKRLGIEP
jgi:transcriptional regulator with GAF, ATPase, and Fis domain